jgi:hypothetical protein
MKIFTTSKARSGSRSSERFLTRNPRDFAGTGVLVYDPCNDKTLSRGSGIMLSKTPTKTPTKAPAKTPAGPDRALLARFAAIVGDKHAITDREAQAPYLIEMCRDRRF